MKAITLWQPWASLIALGVKTIETRTHDRFRWLAGQRIAIHAGLRFADYAADDICRALDGRLPVTLGRTTQGAMDRLRDPDAWPRGAVVCTAQVKDFRLLDVGDTEAACCDCDSALWGLILDDIAEIRPPVPARGHQGVWDWRTA